MLIDEGLITAEQLNKAIVQQKQSGLRLGQLLIRMGLVTEEGIIAALGDQAGIPYVNLDNYIIDPKVISLIPESLARANLIIPLFKIGATLTIAMADPLNVKAIDEARRKAGCEVDTAILPKSISGGPLTAISAFHHLLKILSKKPLKGT